MIHFAYWKPSLILFAVATRQSPAGQRVDSMSVNGTTYDVYIEKYQKDASGNNGNTCTLCSVLRAETLVSRSTGYKRLYRLPAATWNAEHDSWSSAMRYLKEMGSPKSTISRSIFGNCQALATW